MTASASVAVTAEWRRAVVDRLDELGMSRSDLARTVQTSTATISMLLSGRQPASAFVPAIERAIQLPAIRPAPPPLAIVTDQRVAEVSDLRAARDAIAEDIVRLEAAQAAIAERIAEAYQARAELEIEIRRLRAAGAIL